MKKQLFFLTMLLLTSLAFAQIPTDYVARYDFTNNLANAVSGGTALTANNTSYAFVNDRNGQANAAIDFSGASMSGHVFPATSSNPVNSFSVSVWLKLNPGAPSGRRGIVSLYSQTATSNAERFYISRESNDKLFFFFRTEDGTQITASENIPNLYNGGWHNIIVTLKKNGANFDASVHVNGVKNTNLSSALDFQQANTNDNFLESNTVLELARTGIGTEQFSSFMDDLMLFDRAINTTEVYAINGQVLRYVNKNATGDDNGTSWANAYTSMETALANDADGQEIWVAKGNYYVPSSSTTLGFVVDKQVKIYGGFNGTETDIEKRNYITNKTVFSGDVQQNDNIANFPFNENEPTRTDNAARVIHIARNNVTLDGIVVRDGHSSLAFSGIGLQSGLNSFTLVNSEIAYNYSKGINAGVGGAISVNSNYKINNNHFHHNSANTATGIYFYTINSPTFNIDVANNLFDNNRIKAAGQTYSGSAGWLRASASGSTVNVNFINNTLVKNVNDAPPSGSSIVNTVFGFSQATNFSAIQVRVDNNIFWGNTTTGSTSLPKSVSAILGSSSVGTMTISQKNISEDTKIASVTVPSNDPLFTDAATNDFTLQASSPAVDAGVNATVIGTTDVFGLNRIHNNTVDLGAHEYGSASTHTCTNIVNIPDANFKAALLDHGVGITGAGISVIDTDGDGEICQTEAQTYTGTIKVNSKLIRVLTGIEAFTGLTFLECSNNNLTSLDVSMNTALTKLNCSINSLTSLDVSANTALTDLWCNRNNINSLDVSANTSLTIFACDANSLTTLNVANGNNTNMTFMRAINNSNLTCIQTDAGIVGTSPSGWQKDATASYSANCSNPTPDTTAPTVVVQNITVQLDASGNATITPQQIDNGSTDNVDAAANLTFALSKTTFDCSNIGANTVTLTVTDTSNNSANATATVTVQDATQPNIVVQNITVQLDASGNATITPAQINNGSSDNCSIASMSLNKTTFDCSNVGTNQVVLTIVDASNNTSTANATVTVEDSIAPTAVAQNLSVQLGTNNQVTITPAQINNGSSDNCTAVANLTLSLDKTTFTCNDLGANNVTLTVEDANGNQATAQAVVTVTANPSAPLAAIAQNITVQLDANGNATITPQQIDNGSGSGCNSNPTLSLDKTSFDCSNIGANTVTLTVTDGGVSATATATVTVEDTMAPTVNTKAVTVTLSNGQGTITAADVNDNSTDNCTIASTSLDKTSFTCSDLGANTVTLTVTDGQGNSATNTAIVTVVETDAPTVVTQNITVALDANGAATITAQQVDNGSSDGCSGIASMSLDKTSFQCPMLGNETVTLTVTDNSGNSATGTATVTFTAPDKDNDGISDACDSKEVIIAKGFSPNGDGQNETWVIENIDNYPKNTVEIFNRWGEKVYKAINYQNNWDGKANQRGGSDEKLPVGNYLYIINLNESGVKPIQGWIYINY